MEKTNWIEKIKEAVRIAMNKGLYIQSNINGFPYIIVIKEKAHVIDAKVHIDIFKDKIIINTQNGHIKIEYSITDRDDLELRALNLSIKEYNEDIAVSEFEEFISDRPSKPIDINDLDDKEDE